MTGLFLLIWFYLYAGILFARVSSTVGLFPNWHCIAQVLFWPVLLIVHLVKSICDSDFGWFVRYCTFKLKNPGA